MIQDADELLADLLQSLTDDLRSGREPGLEAAARRHPEVADELRELWAAALVAEGLAGLGDNTVTYFEGLSSRRATVEAIGQRIGGYVIQGILGQGGMGIVYRAEQAEYRRVVAIKRLLPGAWVGDPQAARFKNEAAAIARLRHPHIIPLFDIGIHDGDPYFVMQLIEGTNLAQLLSARPLTPRRSAEILVPVARAIQHAHEQGVLHRDLKPSNILIDPTGSPLVADFGLAKVIDSEQPSASLTIPGVVLGTPSYMSPEQALAHRDQIGPATDVYGLGAILYHCLTGRPPFQAATTYDTIRLVVETDPVAPHMLNPRVDPDLEMVALKCLEKDPAHRYLSARDLADDLDRYLVGDPVSARTISLRSLAQRLLAETHHAPVLENWGTLWMLHSLALLVFFGLTNLMALRGVTARWPYVLLFTVGLGAWATVFWSIRRRGGPIAFVERQLAHVWASGVIAINLIFGVEWLLGLPVLSLAPMLAVTNGMLFLVKAGILSGIFYVYALLTFISAIPLVIFPRYAVSIFGLISALCFFATGLKYHLRRRRSP